MIFTQAVAQTDLGEALTQLSPCSHSRRRQRQHTSQMGLRPPDQVVGLQTGHRSNLYLESVIMVAVISLGNTAEIMCDCSHFHI